MNYHWITYEIENGKRIVDLTCAKFALDYKVFYCSLTELGTYIDNSIWKDYQTFSDFDQWANKVIDTAVGIERLIFLGKCKIQ